MSQPSDDVPAVEPATVEPADVRPVEQRLPPAGRKFPCAQCGARLDFDPTERALKCPYCGHVETIAPAAEEAQERDYEAYFKHVAGKETTLAGRSSEVRCPGCGAVVLLEDKVATDQCPYCATHLENQPEAAQDMIAPDCILPFKVPRRVVIEKFNDWVRTRWFAPSDFKNLANLGRFHGVYVPHWTYDSMTYSRYVGQRGDNYTVMVTVTQNESFTTTNAQGQTITQMRPVTKTVPETRIRWTPVSGELEHFFDDVLVCASHSLPPDLLSGLGKWDLKAAEPFKPEFLSGLVTERYVVPLDEGFEIAKGIMDGTIRQLCCKKIGGDHQRLESVRTQHVGVTFKHLLLPVWLAAYRYHDKPYRLMVNARTGQVAGTRPYSWIKITLLVVTLVILAALAFLLFYAATQGRHADRGGAGPPALTSHVGAHFTTATRAHAASKALVPLPSNAPWESQQCPTHPVSAGVGLSASCRFSSA